MIGSNGIRRSYWLFGVDHNQPTERFADFMFDIGIPGTDLAEIDNALQARFFQKGPGGQPKERWELEKVLVNCSPEKIRHHLAKCGFINQTLPTKQAYDYAVWPGALVTRAAARLLDLENASDSLVKWNQTICLGGERPLHPEKESYEECRKVLGIQNPNSSPDVVSQYSWQKINPKTEWDMMRWIWENTPRMYGNGKLNPLFVNAPMKPPIKEGDPPIRPNTEDTILEWLKTNPKPGSVLLSSGAPYGMAMDEAFWMLLEPRGFTVETFGHAAPENLGIEALMREVAGCVNRIRRTRKS